MPGSISNFMMFNILLADPGNVVLLHKLLIRAKEITQKNITIGQAAKEEFYYTTQHLRLFMSCI